ncbi:uncharacterized mitochondrial protein-like protein [Tanacetum coccineum]
MDLCGPMRLANVNGKKYILFIVNDYSRFTYVKCLRTDNGTEFVNQTLREYYEKVDISHETSVARFPQQNGVVEEDVILTAMASEHSSSGPALHEMTPAIISSGLMPNLPPSTPFVPPSRIDWDILFQPMFDELLTPPPSVDYPALHSQTTPETQPPIIHNDVEEDNHDIEVTHMGNGLYFGIPIPEVPSDQSSSTDSIHTINELNGVLNALKDGSHNRLRPDIKVMVIIFEVVLRSKVDELGVDTPMVEKSKLDEDKEGKAVDPSQYHGSATKKHLHAVKRIFWYLRGIVNRGLWYPKDSSIALTAFADVDHAGCQDTRRRTSRSDILLSQDVVLSNFVDEIIGMLRNGVIELYLYYTGNQMADIFTKALARERIKFLINKLGMRSFTPETLKQLADEVDE